MAIEAPDPKTFGSWEEAFQYPIVTVRSMERQLRGDIETNQGRLRALVGYFHLFLSAGFSEGGMTNDWHSSMKQLELS